MDSGHQDLLSAPGSRRVSFLPGKKRLWLVLSLPVSIQTQSWMRSHIQCKIIQALGGEQVGVGRVDVKLRQQDMMGLTCDSGEPRGLRQPVLTQQTAQDFSVSPAISCSHTFSQWYCLWLSLKYIADVWQTTKTQHIHLVYYVRRGQRTYRWRQTLRADQDEATRKQIREHVSKHTAKKQMRLRSHSDRGVGAVHISFLRRRTDIRASHTSNTSFSGGNLISLNINEVWST